MMKKATFVCAFVAFMLQVSFLMGQTITGSKLNLNNSYSITDPKTGTTTSLSSFWFLEFINNDELVFKTGSHQPLVLASNGVTIHQPLYTNNITSNSITANGGIMATGSISANVLNATSLIRGYSDLAVDGNIGIGTTSPAERLHIPMGYARVDDGFLLNDPVFTSDWGNPWYGISMGDNVGIKLNEHVGSGRNPILFQSFYGLGFRTSGGKMTMSHDGHVTIGLDDSAIETITNNAETSGQPYRLFVGGGIRAEKVNVSNKSTWPDYVFSNTYQLRPLSEVADFIAQNSHLPEVPSATEINKNGIDVAEMNATLLKKIEELTLYTIQQQQQMEALNKKLQLLEEKLEQDE